jgi:hypothetical protein
VRLTYSRDASDFVGAGLTAGVLLLGAWSLARRRSRRRAADAQATPVTATPMTTDACDLPPATRRWGGVLPAAVLAALVGSRLAIPDRARAASREAALLHDKAVQARGEGRYGDAAEYARHAAARASGPLRSGFSACARTAWPVRAARRKRSRQGRRRRPGAAVPS